MLSISVRVLDALPAMLWTLPEISAVALRCCEIVADRAAFISLVCAMRSAACSTRLPRLSTTVLPPATAVRLSSTARAIWLISPWSVLSHVRICSVERAVCPDSDFTSAATTEKPRPASPARAASMVALSASRLVWLEIVAMVPAMVPISAMAFWSSWRRSSIWWVRSRIASMAERALPTSDMQAVMASRAAAALVPAVAEVSTTSAMEATISSMALAMVCVDCATSPTS